MADCRQSVSLLQAERGDKVKGDGEPALFQRYFKETGPQVDSTAHQGPIDTCRRKVPCATSHQSHEPPLSLPLARAEYQTLAARSPRRWRRSPAPPGPARRASRASCDSLCFTYLLAYLLTCSGSSRPLALCTARSSRKQSSRLTVMHAAPTSHGEPGSAEPSATVMAVANASGPTPSIRAFIEASTPCASPSTRERGEAPHAHPEQRHGGVEHPRGGGHAVDELREYREAEAAPGDLRIAQPAARDPQPRALRQGRGEPEGRELRGGLSAAQPEAASCVQALVRDEAPQRKVVPGRDQHEQAHRSVGADHLEAAQRAGAAQEGGERQPRLLLRVKDRAKARARAKARVRVSARVGAAAVASRRCRTAPRPRWRG
eukprot:scaffold18451_cov73-Phaeocystis_antarctica.AAC.1